MPTDSTLTHERLLEVLTYDPETGVFTWNVKTAYRTKLGSKAGSLHSSGYVLIRLDGRTHRAHRLAWFYVHGKMPEADVDHRDGVRHNNRMANLRNASRETNCENQRAAHRGSKTGILGVSPYRGRFVARIRINKVSKHIGVFDTPEEAHTAYLEQKRLNHKGCTI